MITIGILKENFNDNRVCLLPEAVVKLKEKGLNVLFESQAGHGIGVLNDQYQKVGAICTTADKIYKQADIICSISHKYDGEELGANPKFIGIFNPLFKPNELEKYPAPSSVYSLDLLPRSTLAQRMDVLSSMSSLSGYKAVMLAANSYRNGMAMLTTPAGTMKPAKVLILGAGVAGLQATATAKRLGAIVEAFDVRSSAAEEVKSLGAKFIEVAGYMESDTAGGYAITQSPEYQKKQQTLIHEHALQANIIICTANIPGKRAPSLLKAGTINQMQKGSIIIDMASEQGGNCELSVDNATVNLNGVTIIGNSHLSKELAPAASKLLSNNYLQFINHLLDHPDSELINKTLVIDKGQGSHPALQLETA